MCQDRDKKISKKTIPTQLAYARKGMITKQMNEVAINEHLAPELVCKEIAEGKMIIPANLRHKNLTPIGIGTATRCKVNVNIGNSSLCSGIKDELEKLKLSIKYGADTVMDLSTGKDINLIRRRLLENCPIPLGTVPLYQALEEVDSIEDLTREKILQVIEHQAREGVDYMTIHCGLLRKFLTMAKKRICGIVSRGGSIMAHWMAHHKKENPFYEHFNDILDICQKYDVTLSLGDALRPGSLADASDEVQFAELAVLGNLAKQCRKKDVQVMIEGPGHIPLDQIQMNVEKEVELCHGAPFYVLGPVVTDIAPGYDHITSAIGGTLAAFYGASMLCYVTPKEHLGLPNAEDVRQGLIAYKIAAHAADVARKRPGARDRDDEMAHARFAFDWEKQFSLSLDPERAREYREQSLIHKKGEEKEYCSMCGPKFCAMAINKSIIEAEAG